MELGALRFHLFTNTGFFRTNCDEPVLNHNHVMYEVQFIHNGSIALSLEEGFHEVPEGSFCVIPPGVYHSQQRPPSGKTAHKTCFSFRYDVMSPPKHGYSPNDTEALLRALRNAPFFITPDSQGSAALINEIKRELHAGQLGFFDKAQCMFGQVLIDILRATPGMQTAPSTHYPPALPVDNRLDIIETFFSEHFGRPLKEDDLAGLLYISHRQLNRILHDLYGMSFRRKLQHTRIQVAMDLLQHTDLTVKEIAARVGYPFAENFHAQFKALTNTTPTGYRNHAASGPDENQCDKPDIMFGNDRRNSDA